MEQLASMTKQGTGFISSMIRPLSYLFAHEAGIYLKLISLLMVNLLLGAWLTLGCTSSTTTNHSAGIKVKGLDLSFISLKWNIRGKRVVISVMIIQFFRTGTESNSMSSSMASG